MADKNSKRKKIILHFALSFCILIFAFCIKGVVYAAELNLTSQAQEINVDQQFQVDVILNTEGEQINAVEGKIVFPDIVELKEIRDGNSIVNFWIEKPQLTSLHEIVFSGITPGGYLGKKGLLFSAVFQAKKKGGGLIEIQNAKTLLNDGKGTEAKLEIFNFQFSIFKEAPAIQPSAPEIRDLELPEDFKPEIASDPNVFDGKYFLVFATQDKSSGISHYEIKESRQKFLKILKKWVIAESPYVLKDQRLKSYVYIKAVDKAGNERIAVVEPRYPMRWYENWWIWIIIILVIIFSFIAIKGNLWKKQ